MTESEQTIAVTLHRAEIALQIIREWPSALKGNLVRVADTSQRRIIDRDR